MSETVASLFDETVKKLNNRAAIQYFCKNKQRWCTSSWRELESKVNKLSNGLRSIDVGLNSCIAILSLTRPEWVIADLAIIKASYIVVPIYHSSLSDQINYIVSDANVKIVFVENEEQLTKVRAVQQKSSTFKKIIIFDKIKGNLKKNEIYFEDFIKDERDKFETADNQKRNDVASIVYTSGTTGEPKGAMITHDNLLYEAQVIDKLEVLSDKDVQLIFLPLAHIFARVLEVAWIRTGHLLSFAQSIEKIIDNMAEIKPTFMASVPRIYEKVRARIMERALSGGFLKTTLCKFAFTEADKFAKGKSSKLKIAIAKKLVFNKIGKELNDKFGGRLRFLVSGGAQLVPEVATFFSLCGITICEGYGLTETTAATCLNLPWSLKMGTVGKPVPGTEVRLAKDSELWVRGRGVFKGFYKKEEQTKEVLNDDGWFKTGDIGHIDDDGFVKIIDRKRDIIVTSQGKNIAPARVENLIKSKSDVIAHVVVIGDKLPYLTALIALDKLKAEAVAKVTDNEASILNLSVDKNVLEEVKQGIALANKMLASFEQVKRFVILGQEFKVGLELTPTLKVKRKYCIDKFAKEIRRLYP